MTNLKALKVTAVISLIALAIVAFALGFWPLEESARRAGIGIPVLLPVLVDLGLVLMGLGAMAARANGLLAWPMRLMATLLILVSAAVQYFHAMAQKDATVIDIVVAVLPPLVLWASSSAVETLIFGQSVQSAVERAQAEEARVEARRLAQLARAEARKASAGSSSAKGQKATPAPTPKQAPKPEPVKARHGELSAPNVAPERGSEVTVATESKVIPAKAPTPGLKNRSLDDFTPEELQEAIDKVLAGASVSSVAKEHTLARSSLARKVEAYQKANGLPS